MVKFIVGKANCDISARVRGELVSLLKSGEKRRNIVYIVPDQFESETEKAVYGSLKKERLLERSSEVRVLTFSALSSGILRESGETRGFADDVIKIIAMRRAVNDNKSALSSLSKIASKAGFCEKMVQTVSVFKTAGITPRDLEKSLENMELDDDKLNRGSPVVKKLAEAGMLYGHYEALLSDYIDSLDVTGMAADIIEKPSCETFDGACVFVDCFNDFTSSQLRFLCNVIGKAELCALGFAAEIDSEKDVFFTARAQISRLRSHAAQIGCEAEMITDGIPDRMAEGSPLRELSKRIFGTEKSAVPLGESCELVSAASVYEEMDYVAAKIKTLVSEKGMRYRDIAVLCTDAGVYGKYAESAFKKYDIPLFMDVREPILYQPLINTVISLLNVLRDFSADTVLSYIKTGFLSKPDNEKNKRVGLTDKDVDVFESYIYEWALEAEHLKKPFTCKNSRVETDLNMLQAEEIRAAVVQPVLELQKKLPKRSDVIDGAELTEMLYNFLTDDIGISRALFARCTDENNGLNGETVAYYQRLWNSLIGIFNSLYEQLKGANITLEDYYRLFRDICAGATLASPPQFIDCVLVGDIDRTRADNIKAAFIVGADYEAFPTPAPKTGIFSQYETELIRENITHLGERCLKSVKEQYCLSLYRAYRAVSLPTEYLCISCPERSASGEETQRSDVITGITALFPGTEIIKAGSMDDRFYCRSVKAAKMRYAFSENDLVLRKALEDNGCADFTEKLDEIRGARRRFTGKHTVSEATAKRLFSRRIGATAIEKLNLCRFEYFCQKGLGIEPRQQRSFNRSKRGDAVHYVLEKVLREYSGDTDKFIALERGELFALSRKYLSEYCARETNNDFSDDERTRFLFGNIANSAADVLITLQTEFYSRSYRPKFFELDISDQNNPKPIIDNERRRSDAPPEAALYSERTEALPEKPSGCVNGAFAINTRPLTVTLDNGLEITIGGRIDRVDMFSEEGEKNKIHVRVADYKSSVKSFDLNNARSGINIQMLLYLFALCDANKDDPDIELLPGGVSYVPSKNSGAPEEELPAYRLLTMSYHPNEMFVNDKATKEDLEKYANFIIEKIRAEGADEKTLEKIREAVTPNSRNSVDAEFFDRLRDDCMKTVKNNLEAIFGGDVSALPLSYRETNFGLKGAAASEKLACDYCEFSGICGNAGKVAAEPEKDWENPYLR